MFGHHQNHLVTLTHQLQSLSANVSDLVTTFLGPPMPPPAPLLHCLPLDANLVCHPQKYSGEPGACRALLTQCWLIFLPQLCTFSSDPSRIVYVITQLSGRASCVMTCGELWCGRRTLNAARPSALLRFGLLQAQMGSSTGTPSESPGSPLCFWLGHRFPYFGDLQRLEGAGPVWCLPPHTCNQNRVDQKCHNNNNNHF